jgi:type II secretory pathway pseudopilin PulG
MLVVVIIIATLTALTVGVAKYALTKGATSRAQAEIAAMEMALEHYKSDNGVYPTSSVNRATLSGYPSTIETYNSAALYTALAGGPKIYYHFKADEIRSNSTLSVTYVVDPFGNPYNYYQTNVPTLVTNVATFDLWSYGPNGTNDEGANDDITNWRR